MQENQSPIRVNGRGIHWGLPPEPAASLRAAGFQHPLHGPGLEGDETFVGFLGDFSESRDQESRSEGEPKVFPVRTNTLLYPLTPVPPTAQTTGLWRCTHPNDGC